MPDSSTLVRCVLIMVLIGAVVATSSVGVVTAAEQDADSDRFTLTGEDDDLLVWGGSLLTLRSDTSSAETTVPIHDVFYNETERNVVIEENRDNIAVYSSPQDVTIDFKTRSNADISKFDDDRNAQVILASFEQNEKTETVGGLDALNDVLQPGLDGNLTELRTQAAKRNVTFEINNSVGTNVGDGNFKYNLNETFDSVDSGDSGPYITMLALPRDEGETDPDGFNVTDNPGDTDGEDLLTLPGNATLVGVESVAVHEEQSSFDAPNSITAGDDFEVDPDSSLSGDVTQSVLVYREDTFLGEETTVKIDGQFSTGLNESDITLQHSIQDVNGVGNMTADGNLFGIKSQQRIVAGTTPLGDIVDQLSNESDTNVTRESIAPNTTIDASGTTVPDWNGENVTVETYGNWTSGTYRVVHAAENGTVEGFETSTTTIEVSGQDSPNFEVSDISVGSGVTEGENLSVNYTIKNTGDLPDKQSINLTVDGDTQNTTELSLDPGNSSTVSAEVTTERGDAGVLSIGVESEDNSDTVEATILQGAAPQFEVSITDINATVTEGETIVAEYDIENTGDFSNTQDIRFLVDGDTKSTDSGTTLSAGETTTQSASYETNPGESPVVNITIASANTSATFNVDVREPSVLELEDDFTATPDNVTVGQSVKFNGTINNTGDISNSTRIDLERSDDSEVLDSTNVSLSGGESREVEFNYLTRGDDNVSANTDTTYNLTINYDDSRVATERVDVNVTDAESDFDVNKTGVSSDLSADGNVSVGDTVIIESTINNSVSSGTTTVALYGTTSNDDELGNNQDRIDQTEISLGAGEKENVTLTHTLPTAVAGQTVNYSVGTPDRIGAERENATVNVNSTAQFDITDVQNVPSSVTAGNPVELNTTIKNTGGEPATKSVSLLLNGDIIDQNNSVALDPDQETDVTFTGSTGLADAGQDLGLTVRTADDSNSSNQINVNAPASYQINNIDVNQPVQGEDINVSVTVNNVGDLTGDKNLTVEALGSSLTNETDISVSGGSTTTENINVSTESLSSGDQSILVTTENNTNEATDDSAIARTTIQQPKAVSPTIDSITDPVLQGSGVTDEDLNVTATLTNDGDVDGSVNVTLDFAGNIDRQNEVTVPAGDTTQIELNISESSITTDDNNEDATVTVINGSADGQNTTTVREAVGVTEVQASAFRVSGFSIDDRTYSDDILRGSNSEVFATATVTNIGDQTGEQTIELLEEGTQINSTTKELSADETSSVNFSIDQDTFTSGDRTITIRTDDSSASTTKTVRDQTPPRFEVSLENDVTDLQRGDVINASIENTGDQAGTLTTALTLTYDGKIGDSDSLTQNIAAGDTLPADDQPVTITVPDDAPRAGEFDGELNVSSPNTTDTVATTVDFGTINESLAAASPGDTITLAGERFTDGPVTVNKSVTLTGSGTTLGNETTVDVADPVTITGVTVSDTDRGIVVSERSGETTIKNTVFSPSVTEAVITHADDTEIENNRFVGNVQAINLTDTGRSRIENNSITGSTKAAINSTAGIHTVENNNLEPDGPAINATFSDGFIDATDNYWGKVGGPVEGIDILSPVEFKPFDTSPNEAPDYQIENTNLTSINEVVAGETIEVNATINNTGGTNGVTEDELVLRLDGERQNSLSFDETNFSSGNATADGLELTVDDAKANSINTATLELATDDDTVTQSDVEVNTAPEFEVEITDNNTDAQNEIESDQTLTVDVNVNNTGQAGGSVTADLQFDGSQKDSTTTRITGNGDTTLSLEYALSDSDVGNAVPITVDVGDDTATDTVTVTKASPPDDDGGDDDDGSSGGGGGGVDEEEQTESPTLEDVRADLEQSTPDTETNTDIVDNDPDTPGVQIEPEGTESVQRISFDNEDASGRVNIREYQSPPESVSQSVAAAVSSEDTGDETTTTESQVNVVTVADITPDSEGARESPATVTLTVDSDQLDNPQNAVVVKEQENSWTTLETTVEETSEEEVTLEARAESFSLFAVAEVGDEDQPPTQTDDGQTEPSDDGEPEEPEDEGGIGGAGAIIGLILLVLIGVGVYIYQQQ